MLLLLSYIALFFIVKRGSFTSIFLGIAFLFLLFFYIYPLFLLLDESNYYYAGYNFAFSKDQYLFSCLAGVSLVLGFFIPDIILIVRGKKKNFTSDLWQLNNTNTINYKYKFKKIFYIIVAIVLFYYIYGLMDPNRALKTYEIRRGNSEGSIFDFLITIIINSLFFSVLFCLIYAKKAKSIFLLLLIKIFYLLTGSTGRSVLMLHLLLTTMFVSKIKAKHVVLVSIGLLIILMPIILNLKGIIYSISVESKIPNLIDIYTSKPDVDLILTNFGHPLVSLLNVHGLVDLVGFRFFYDYLQGFLFYLRAFGLDFGDSLIYYNTENILGVRSSIVPTGYLAFGYTQMGFIGIIISGMFYRFVGYISEFLYYKIQADSNLIKLYLAYFSGISFYHGEIRVMVISFFIPTLILYLFRPSKLTIKHLL